MKQPTIIVAVDEDGGFASDGKIPWYSKKDFAFFKKKTLNAVCIMGRRTYEDILELKKNRGGPSIISAILPNRDCFVISKTPNYSAPGAIVKPSLCTAIQSLKNDDREIFVLGGERLFTQTLAWTEKIYMTVIKGRYNCDRFFPVEYVHKYFDIVDGEEHDDLYFLEYRRVKWPKQS